MSSGVVYDISSDISFSCKWSLNTNTFLFALNQIQTARDHRRDLRHVSSLSSDTVQERSGDPRLAGPD